MSDTTSLADILRAATQRLTHAETELSAALKELPLSDRADKRMVTERLQLAFQEILAAKAALLALIPKSSSSSPGEPEES
jgi:hypothetical protein